MFEDRNGNGVQDAGDPGIAGVTVELLSTGGVVVATTTTGLAGDYRFSGLPPGVYAVRFVTPTGYVPTAANQGSDDGRDSDAVGGVTQQVTLTSGAYDDTLDAGFSRPAALGDFVFEDRNGNGVQDAGDPGIAGVTVELLSTGGVVVATTTTGLAGDYRFSGLPPGVYAVRFVTPTGYVPTAANQGSDDGRDSDAVGGVTQQVTLTSGAYDDTLDAGFFRPAALGDFVFEDRNGNGVQDAGDPGIAGVTVELLSTGGVVVATTTTGLAGDYRFSGLPPGVYAVRFVTPTGYVPTAANQGSDDGRDSDAVGGVTQQVTLTSGAYDDTLDAGFFRPAALGDFVFEDRNGNGVQDAGDPGIAGVVVELLSTGGVVVATTTTGLAGDYRFSGLPPGVYAVRFVTPTGYVPTAANQGSDDGRDSDAVAGVTQQVTLTSGAYDDTLDAGFFRPAALGDFVFEDRNGNGVQDAGDPGIAGVAVELLSTGGVVVATTTTGLAGDYRFSGLPPGVYAVRFVTPTGYVPTAANQGSDDGRDSDAVAGVTQQVTLTSGAYDDTLDAGFFRQSSAIDLEKFTRVDINPLHIEKLVAVKQDAPVYLDADTGPGPQAQSGTRVLFRYEVTNSGSSPISDIHVTDSNISSVVFTEGDINHNGLLDPMETWIYRASQMAGPGLHTNTGYATGKVDNFEFVAMDKANYTGIGLACPDAGPIGGVDLGSLTSYLFVFGNGSQDAKLAGSDQRLRGQCCGRW